MTNLYGYMVMILGGVYSELRYKIVDESGLAQAPLEDGVETRFGMKDVGGYEVVDIRVLFDLRLIAN